jgi:Niemann-Pick C1 protein
VVYVAADAHIRLLFDIQDEVDALTGSYTEPGAGAGGGGGGSWNVSLADVCLAPLGGACATQSVLQYWAMDREVFEHGERRRAGSQSAGLPTSD